MSEPDLSVDGYTLIRCASHRARERLFRAITGSDPYGFYSWDSSPTGGFYLVPDADVSLALSITGCSRASTRFQYHRTCY